MCCLWKLKGGRCTLGFPGGPEIKNPPAMQETWVGSLGWEDTLRRKWQSTPVSCLEYSMEKGAWQATVHGVTKVTLPMDLTQGEAQT